MPDFVEFQHPRLVSTPPNGAEWLHEIKFDGYRLQVQVRGGAPKILTRNGHDWTAKFPELARDISGLPDCVLDGELCALDEDGYSNFSNLRASITPGKTGGLVLFTFDLLWRGGEDLRPFALAARKAALRDLLAEAATPRLRWVDHFDQGGPALLQSACRLRLEGVVSKRKDAPYRAGRGETWLKSKCRPGQEVVIGGWVQERLGRFKALLVGVYEHGELRYVGSVKTGFKGSADLLRQMESLRAERSPFARGDPPWQHVNWTRPELVANLDIAEWTTGGQLRQASFKGLREDKDPREVVRESG
ncbi:non-homologous end-joining DNA ligase [Phenylobacterium sp.]|jgi:bifunctional non-homologous end joining protein LigD|uniref:non-homologous end-joining DNA ligase n=1 Tax=Phenylobacterium sp. TaxID=1871053 RepID=UPI002E2EB175|nr:non-homologous end-joining DNA ligase [Phenylobacterium sp.]HEX2559219.1 non-homologous end-joining DNA ligase [Phenylobacterium sp.]